MTISEVLKQPAGAIIDHVWGHLVEVGEYENKVRPDGEPYTAQDFFISDGPAMLNGTIYDHYPLDKYKGTVLYFCSMKSRNGRFGGVKVAKLAPESIFSRKPESTIIRVSKAGSIQSPDTFPLLKRKETETTNE